MLEAFLLKREFDSIKSNFKTSSKTTISTTKTSISVILGEMDSALKGEVRDELELLVEETLPKYDKIF